MTKLLHIIYGVLKHGQPFNLNHHKKALRQVCSRFRVVTHPAPALGCVCENVQHQGVVPVCRMRRG